MFGIVDNETEKIARKLAREAAWAKRQEMAEERARGGEERGHTFSANGVCMRCGCSEEAAEKFGWECRESL